MTVNIVQNNSHDKSALLVALQSEVTALAAIVAPNSSQVQLLKSKQEQLVRSAIDARRLDPAAIITTMSINTSLDPAVGQLITKLATQIGGGADDLLRSARLSAIENAIAKGQTSAASILSTMT